MKTGKWKLLSRRTIREVIKQPLRLSQDRFSDRLKNLLVFADLEQRDFSGNQEQKIK